MAQKLFADQAVRPAAMRQNADQMEKAFERLRTEQQRSLEYKLKESNDQESR